MVSFLMKNTAEMRSRHFELGLFQGASVALGKRAMLLRPLKIISDVLVTVCVLVVKW